MAINQAMFDALQPGVNELNRAKSQQAQSEQEIALRKYLQAQEPAIAGQKQAAENAANLETAQNPQLQNMAQEGGAVGVGNIHFGANPYAKIMSQGPKQAQSLVKMAQGAYKPINDQLDASQATLDSLNQGNAVGDKLALINEAKLGLAGSGGRAMGQLVSLLSGDSTMAGDAQKAMNWLQNTPNIPTLQPAQRDAIRESVYGRLGQVENQHNQATQQLAQVAPTVAPQADANSVLTAFSTPAQSKIQSLKKMQAEYQAQRAKQQAAGNSPISTESTANANPTTYDRLKSFLHFGASNPQSAPGAGGMAAAAAAEIARRRGGK